MSYLYLMANVLCAFSAMTIYSASHHIFAQSGIFYVSCVAVVMMLVMIRNAMRETSSNIFFIVLIQGLSVVSGLILSEGYKTTDAGLVILALILFTACSTLFCRLMRNKLIP